MELTKKIRHVEVIRHQLLSESLTAQYQQKAHDLPELKLTARQLCDLELLLNGGFYPLTGFMAKRDYDSVLETMHLADGTLWPMPITLDVDAALVAVIGKNNLLALRDAEGLLLAILQVEDIWQADKLNEALTIFGTIDDNHPGVHYLLHESKSYYVGGKLLGISLPHHYDFEHLRLTPDDLQQFFSEKNITNIVAFQTRNPMHRAHQELTLRAAEKTNAAILIHPVVGMTKPGDIEYYTRVRCYEQVLKTYPDNLAHLSLLPLAMRMGGPKEALWHAIIRRNYGCTHFIVGRDHAGPGKDKMGQPFYDAYAAQKLALHYQDELGIQIIPFQEMVYSHQQKRYFAVDDFPKDETPATISGTELREALRNGTDIPEWFSYQSVIAELRRAYPARHHQGFTLFFTGLPSSGKSTIAQALALKLRELLNRPVTLLDGDVIRTHLSQELGFSAEDREKNIMRVGFVAQEITRHSGIAICALVAPFASARDKVRRMVSEVGGFIEVFVATPLDVCETRDRKGLYKRARLGAIKQFTGVSDPYEAPNAPEIKIDTSFHTPEIMIERLIKQIKLLGYIQ